MLGRMDLLGAVVAIASYVSAILVFSFRLLVKPQYGIRIGYFEFLLAVPMVFLLLKAPQLERPVLYYIQIGCMLGVASNAGREWSISAIVLFLIMAVLTFVQRAVTGM